jgi:hypothetical protein
MSNIDPLTLRTVRCPECEKARLVPKLDVKGRIRISPNRGDQEERRWFL